MPVVRMLALLAYTPTSVAFSPSCWIDIHGFPKEADPHRNLNGHFQAWNGHYWPAPGKGIDLRKEDNTSPYILPPSRPGEGWRAVVKYRVVWINRTDYEEFEIGGRCVTEACQNATEDITQIPAGEPWEIPTSKCICSDVPSVGCDMSKCNFQVSTAISTKCCKPTSWVSSCKRDWNEARCNKLGPLACFGSSLMGCCWPEIEDPFAETCHFKWNRPHSRESSAGGEYYQLSVSRDLCAAGAHDGVITV